ncbi:MULTISPECIES: hypothetical protein [unclassified Lentimonas]|uniref:DUF7305 domain-containing protein n=1 Tax=unclassified Lentimonas TaxID=2630993 RepID=UPI0013276E28|nr:MULTISPECIES: hypothetical protein [unclassified Lentimonas]CAA6676436.1 Unannotated [Lentimonas sp. CC4]CAA6685275.1 Unannotated [Lentimonas sp. CC6]CAA7075000.1 Unannotated [Lentimonas sp. CC4]CAA7171047.1 Unannotated [Lentimonas sp. CC21]CAA7180642.1 Unannotated [Lentimonas sp. CC8]
MKTIESTFLRSTHGRNTCGSILLTAIIFATVFSVLLGSVIQYSGHTAKIAKRASLRDVALHLAESGIEIGINELQENGVAGLSWQAPEGGYSYEVGSYIATVDVAVTRESSNSDLYEIHSLATIPFAGGLVQRAVVVEAQSDMPGEGGIVDVEYSTPIFANAVAARFSIKILHGNGDKRPLYASYSSDQTTDPVYGQDTGYAASIVTIATGSSAIQVNNAIINGILNSGGGEIGYDSGKTNSNQLDQNLWLSLSPEDSADSLNSEGIQQNYNGEINDPVYPDTSEYWAPAGQTEITSASFWNSNDPDYGVDQNYWQNGSDADVLFTADGDDRVIGATGEQVVLSTPSINLQNGSQLTVKGDVVLYVKNGFNIHGDIYFEEGATLHLISDGNNHFTGSTYNDKPIQFQVTPYVDLSAENPSGPNVQFNNDDRIAMVINAPYSSVSTGGQGNGIFDYLGAIVAGSFSCPNGVNFFYDTTLGVATEDEFESPFDSVATDAIFAVKSWKEVVASDSALN